MEKVGAVKVRFSHIDKKYIYLLPPNLTGKVCVGNYVVVPAVYSDMPYQVAKVVKCTSDLNDWCRDDADYPYVIDKIDTIDYFQRKADEEKSDEFHAIMESINTYCNKWGVEHLVTAKRDFVPYRSVALVTTITLTDFNRYAPFYNGEPQ